MKKVHVLLSLFILLLVGCTTEEYKIVSSTSPEIEYWGRVDSTNYEGTALFWSGTSIIINFEGKSIEALLQDESGDNYYNILIDKDSAVLLRPDTSKSYYQLASNLSEGKHTVEIFKRTEFDRGKTLFYGFRLDESAKILPKQQTKSRKIEFYGNSITAGYAVEDFSGKDLPDSVFTNNYLSYSALTARHFDAQYQCICKSGIGITISWFPYIMPDIYDRINPSDSKSKCDFSRYTPDVVVVNLFQNDSWLVNMPERADFKKNFGTTAPDDDYLVNAYQQFVLKLRTHYPNAKIICALGSMDITKEGSKWPGIIEQAVSKMEDGNMYTHFMPYKNSPGHPSIKEQEVMAKSLIQFIDDNIAW